MSTGTEIIERSLQMLGSHSKLSPADPESIELGFEFLNSMLEIWQSSGINIGFTPLKEPGSQLNEPPDTRNGIIQNLAVLMEGQFNNGRDVLSERQRGQATASYHSIKRKYETLTIPKSTVSSTLPVGSGNQVGRWESTFFGEDAELDN